VWPQQCSTCQAGLQRKPSGEEKFAKKALIPLPPTGFASFFFAKPEAVQTSLEDKPAVGQRGQMMFALDANF